MYKRYVGIKQGDKHAIHIATLWSLYAQKTHWSTDPELHGHYICGQKIIRSYMTNLTAVYIASPNRVASLPERVLTQ